MVSVNLKKVHDNSAGQAKPHSKRPKPIHVEVAFDSEEPSNDYRRSVIFPALSKGEMPHFLKESERLIGEGETPEADKVISYIRSILDRLSQATTGEPSPDLKIYLSDQQSSNTGVITSAGRYDIPEPIMIIGMDLIDLIIEKGYGEDHLASVLGHERFHLRRHEKWPDLSNGRPEENISDIYGVIESEKAGYNPQALGDLFRALRDLKKGQANGQYNWDNALTGLIDEHGDIDVRIRNTDLALANLQLTKRMAEGQTNIPDDIVEACKNVRFKTNFDRFVEANQYVSKTPVEQMTLMGRYFSQEIDRKAKYMRRMWRYRDYDPYVSNLHLFQSRDAIKTLRQQDGIQHEAYRWFRYFASQESDAEEQYEWVLKKIVNFMAPAFDLDSLSEEQRRRLSYIDTHYFDMDVKPRDVIPPVYQRLETDSKAFWAAQTREEAVTAAKRFKAADRFLERFQGAIDVFRLREERVSMPSRNELKREIKEEGIYILPWRRHLEWALDPNPEHAEDAKLIAETATDLGCDDLRMPGGKKNKFGFERDEVSLDDLTFDKNGNIVAVKPTQEEIEEEIRKRAMERFEKKTLADLMASEYDIQKEREAHETELVKETDWQALEADFWAFVKKHQEHLQPPLTVVPGKFPFAERFVQELEALWANNPEKWADTYNTFFTGYSRLDREMIERARQRDRGGPDRNSLSLPVLIQGFKNTYFNMFADSDIQLNKGTLPERHPMHAKLMSLYDMREPKITRRFNKETKEREVHKTYPDRKNTAQHLVQTQVAIDASHPFLKVILHLDEPHLNVHEKAWLVEAFDYFNPSAKSLDAYFKISPRHVFGYATPQSFRDFDRITRKARTDYGMSDVWRRAYGIELLRIFRRYDQMEQPQRLSISGFNFFDLTYDFWQFQDKKAGRELGRELKALVKSQIKRNKRIDFSKATPLETLLERYLEDHGQPLEKPKKRIKDKLTGRMVTDHRVIPDRHHNIFATRPDLEKEYQAHIQKRIMALPIVDREKHLATLMSLELRDPDYRNWAIKSWVQSAFARFGLDDGSEEYAAEALKFIKLSVQKISSTQGMNCLVQFLDTIEAQKAVAMGGKDILVNVFGRRFLEKDGAMRVIEGAIETCAHNPILRDGFLKYITEPLTPEGTHTFAQLLKAHAAPQGFSNKDSFVSRFFNPRERINMNAAQENIMVDQLHQNFWDMPFGLRTIYLDRILFPVKETDEGNFDKAVAFVLDKVLPEERKYATEAREALLVYLGCCPPELRRTTFSAILATAEQAAETGDLRPGEVLSQVLTRTGAAGGQLLQAAHSYLNGIEITDPDLAQFRDDLVSSKDDFDRPFRPDVFERMDKVLPEDERDQARVGKILGCGSTAYVVEYGDDALKLMREDVVPIAELQFERFLKSFEILAEKQDHYKPLPAMVDHADKLIRISSSGRIGAEQLRYAQECYDPLTVTVNGKKQKFHVAEPVSAGDEYLRMERIGGKNINTLHQQGSSANDLRSKSIAIETAFIYRMMQGKAMDQDMHGAQQGITGTQIGMFDTGAIPYDPDNGEISEPNDSEKRALGQLFGITLNAAMQYQSPVEALVNAVTSQEWGEAKSYLVGVKRGLLARSDIHAAFGQTSSEKSAVLQDIFRAVWAKGHVDPEIFKGFTDTVTLSTCRRLTIHSVGGPNKISDIKIHDANSADVPKLTLSRMASIIVRSGLRRAFTGSSISARKQMSLKDKPACLETDLPHNRPNEPEQFVK